MKRKPNSLKRLNVKGTALIEVLITLAIIVTAFTAISFFSTSLMRTSTGGKQHIQAVNFANSKIEYFRSYQTLDSAAGVLAYQDIVSGSDSSTPQAGESTTYYRTWSVTDFPNASSPDSPAYKVVNVIVSWTEILGSSRAVELVSIIGQIDPGDAVDVVS